MILVDTGPLVALLDVRDRYHQRCVESLKKLPTQPMLTTWPCFTEATYLLHAVGGYRYQENLWDLYTAGRLQIHPSSVAEIHRMHELMKTYQDTPMDLADASLIATAEALNLQQILTLDSDFYIYRLANGDVLEVLL